MVDIIKDIISVLLILLMNPYGIGAMAVVLLVVIIVSIYFGVEAISLSKRFVLKTFYCPFRKKIVNVKFRPSIFTFRTFDDVMECSAFNTGKVTCKKKCLDLPEHQLNTEKKHIKKG